MEQTAAPRAELVVSATIAVRARAQASAFASVLACNATEFIDELHRMAELNPALVVRLRRTCGRCGGSQVGGLCRCQVTPADINQLGSATGETLRQTLLELATTDDQRAVLLALSPHGMLDDEADRELSAKGISGARLTQAIVSLRATGPSALASRTSSELLLGQLLDLDVDAATIATAVRLFGELLEPFIAGNDELLARELQRTQDEIRDLRELFRTRLRPGLQLDDGGPTLWQSPPSAVRDGSASEVSDLSVDVVFQVDGDCVTVAVTEFHDVEVHVDPAWTKALAGFSVRSDERATDPLRTPLRSRTSKTTNDERRQLLAQHEAASRIVRAVSSRAQLLNMVATALAGHHRESWVNGRSAHAVITRRAVADEIGVHESTVSRVVRNRLARLPTGAVVPLGSLFLVDTAAKISTWSVLTDHPELSDYGVACELAKRGVRVARRTVTKYRHELRRAGSLAEG